MRTVAFLAICGGLLAGILLGTLSRRHGHVLGLGSTTVSSQVDQDSLSSSAGRQIAGSNSTNPSDADKAAADRKAAELAEQQREAAAQAQKLAEQQAAAQQAAQQAALDDQKRALEAKAADEAAREKQLEDAQRALAAQAEAERQRRAQEAGAAAEAARLQAEREAHTYRGPSSGEIVWRGDVHGTTLVTISGDSSDSGQVVSGALPGVLVMVQPMDSKHVGVAATPAPSNAFRRLVLRIQGNGSMQEVVHWSIP
ncbi:MAG TPA: hypothetical protein VKB38_10295 [Terracidiphilus sp.]|nr:hypothetical protein [Terracidiphilus sp.]